MQFNLRILAALIAITSYTITPVAAADEQTQTRGVACTRIKTAAQLQAMRNNLAGNYCLANDIDAGTIANFKPVGTAANRFTGRLSGRNHVVRNLRINSAAADVGLFGSIDGAVIHDLSLINVNVTGPDGAYVGGLVGTAYATTAASKIARISVTGLVRSAGASSVGGIVGLLNENAILTQSRSAAKVITTGAASEAAGLVANNRGTIEQSYATGAITGASVGGNTGGLVAANYQTGLVRRSYATGPVTAGDNNSTGGLVGRSTGPVLESYATGAVTTGDGSRAGGLVGWQNGGSITEGYAVGRVSGGVGASLGGLIGQTTGSPIVMNAYWDTQTSGQTTSGGGLGGGLLTTQFRAELPPGFSTAWALTADLSYPFLNDPDIDFASLLATLVQSSKVFLALPVNQFDPAQYLAPPAHADDASLAAVYTMIARAVGVTENDGRLKDVKIDRYFWDDGTQTATWRGPVKTYVSLGALANIPAGRSLNSTNVIGRMNNGRLVILRGSYRKSDGSVATHWLLGTLYTTADDGSVSRVVANDPASGSQIEIHPNTKRVLTPDFPLANFRVNGYRAVVVH